MQIRSLDDIARSLIDGVEKMEKGELSPGMLNAKRNAYATVVKIVEIKLEVVKMTGIRPTTDILALPGAAA